MNNSVLNTELNVTCSEFIPQQKKLPEHSIKIHFHNHHVSYDGKAKHLKCERIMANNGEIVRIQKKISEHFIHTADVQLSCDDSNISVLYIK